ncbi:MAG: hypothetical protein ABIQ01_12005 [Pseudolysinimonas sp.]
MAGRPNFIPLLPIAALALTLSACTPIGQFIGPGGPGAAGPTTSSSPTPSTTPSPEPTSTDCDDAVFTEPGDYHVGDCVRLTVEGHDITVTAGSVGILIITGNANNVSAAGEVGSLTVEGNVNDVDTLDVSSVEIEGRFNQLGVHGSVERVAIDGDDNEVLVDGDIGPVEVRGERNVVNSQP